LETQVQNVVDQVRQSAKDSEAAFKRIAPERHGEDGFFVGLPALPEGIRHRQFIEISKKNWGLPV
jgi:hypothetical protein